jgi:protein gp37
MGDKSNIEWTDATWNPIVGCSIVSPGCTNCYAMSMAARIEAMQPRSHYDGTTMKVKGKPVWTGQLAMAPDHILTAPLRWKKPRKIFVNSMGDLFHESVPDEWIDKVFAVMALCPQHTFQVLTKRSKRMREYCNFIRSQYLDAQDEISQVRYGSRSTAITWPLPNVWLGVSAEDQTRADERIPDLLATPAAVRFVSAEPLLGPIYFTLLDVTNGNTAHLNSLTGNTFVDGNAGQSSQTFKGLKLDWIIAGGESGHGARPMHPDWARSIRDQCQAAGTAFFFKQWGEWVPQLGAVDISDNPEQSRYKWAEWQVDTCKWDYIDNPQWCEDMDSDHSVIRVGKAKAGNLLDGKTHNQFPEVQ